MSSVKSCPEGTEPNPNPNRGKGTRRCLKVCKENEYRDENFNCVSKHKKTRKIKIVDSLAKRVIPNETKEELIQRALDAVSSIRAAKSISKIPESDGPPPQSKMPTQTPSPKTHPCDEVKRLDTEIKNLASDKKMNIIECNKEKYWESKDQPKTHLELLKKIYSHDSLSDCDELFSHFPESGERSGDLYTKPYVFESLWKIIFLLGLDDKLAPGMNRQFIKSIEKEDTITVYDYLSHDSDGKINSGSAFGVCDLAFIANKPSDYKNKDKESTPENACEDGFSIKHGNAFFFTSKFYNKEKGLGNYDVANIHLESTGKDGKKYIPLHQAKDGNSEFAYEIVALVNNKPDFLEKIGRRTDKAAKQFLKPDNVFGYDELRDVYYRKLVYWLKTMFDKQSDIDNSDKWKEITGDKLSDKNILDILRIHQEYFVETTQEILKGETQGKIIWGAVARSGKSYMVGGLIAKRRPKIVILILGAVGETKKQFMDIFKDYADLKEYAVWDTQNNPKNKPKTDGKLAIIVSQEKLRGDIKDNSKNKFLIDELKEYLKEEDKIVFFDEIHQGGSETASQDKTINFFYDKVNNPGLKYPVLIMVTATYTKPLLNYSNGFGNGKLHLINWSYNMIMKMKNFKIDMTEPGEENDNSKLLQLSSVDKTDEYVHRMNILNRIVKKHNKMGKSDKMIAEEYAIYPELVYLIPGMKNDAEFEFDNENGKYQISDSSNIKRLWEVKDDKVLYPNAINKYLDYIYNVVYKDLLRKQYNMVANGEGDGVHTQLWFLPTNLRSDGNAKLDKDGVPKDASVFDVISRGLAESIINNKNFTNFNVCIIHSLDAKNLEPIQDKDGDERIFFKCIKDNDVKTCIKNIEIESKGTESKEPESKNPKKRSLIILTGKRLRLGISLPCVDVAIHMDPIESYDIMYQSMFRVLTERKGKRKGFFVDMIADRSVKFMYNYAIQEKKQTSGDKITRNDIKDTLLLFDVNGLSTELAFAESDILPTSYDMISQKFGIQQNPANGQFIDDGQFEKNVEITSSNQSEIESDMKGLLQTILNNDRKTFKETIKTINGIFTTRRKQKPNKQTEAVTKANVEYKDSNTSPTSPASVLPDEVIDEDDASIIDNAIKSIQNTLTLYSLFSSDNSNTIERILISNQLDYDSIRQCKSDDIIHLCYLATTGISNKIEEYNKRIKDVNKDDTAEIEKLKRERKSYADKDNRQIQEQIDEHLKLIRFVYEYNDNHSKQALNNLYGYISNTMKKMKSKLNAEKESFKDTSSGFCPAVFTNKDNDKVLEIVRKHLTPKDNERKLFGEIFTPLELVCEMLSRLPDGVWTNKNLKWLDPANGIGNFPIVVYYKLMETLKSVPEKDRSKHIIENMLYMNELNPINVALCKKIFKMIDPGSKPNLMTSNFLSEFMVTGKDKFFFGDVKEFDVIIGNPPYNENGVGKGGGVFWKQFVFKAFDLLNDEGLLELVHPLGWRKPKGEHISAGDVFDRFKESLILFVKISDVKIPHFPRVDFYVVQKDAKNDERYLIEKTHKEKSNYKTHVINEFEGIKYDGYLELSDMDFIPNLVRDDVISIIKKISDKPGDKLDIIRNQSFKPNKDDTTSKTGVPHAYYYVPGDNSYKDAFKKYENSAPEYISYNKFVLTANSGKQKGYLYPKYYTKPIGTTANTMYQLIEKNDDVDSMMMLFKSKLINFILKITQYSESPNHKNEFKILNMITKPTDTTLKTDDDVYKYYGITAKEVELIQSVLKIQTKEPKQTRKKQPDKPKTDGGTKPKRKTRRKRWYLF